MAAASILRAIEGAAFTGGLSLLARLVRLRLLKRPTQAVVGLLGALTARVHGVGRQASAEAMARAWQAAFASPKVVPIARVEGDTAFAEICVSCPLRGSGALEACYRLMEFDRRIAARAGATFVVLR